MLRQREARSPGGDYWDHVFADWESTMVHRLWRAHSDAVNRRLVERWIAPGSGRALKTDLFDEAVGDGLYPELRARSRAVCGVDVSPAVVAAAARRYPGLETTVGDVLALPYEDGGFDVTFSNSTLDHFASHRELGAAMRELARTLRRGGTLLITLDNATNPVVALRTSRLFTPLHRAGVVPYFVGATHGPRKLARLLDATGFEVTAMTAVMHCPPQLGAAIRTRLTRRGVDGPRHLRQAIRFEAMESWPTRWLSGHFVAARATRR